MAVLSWTTEVTGFEGIVPALLYINTNDTFATITTPGYLNPSVEAGMEFTNEAMALVMSTTGPLWLQTSLIGTSHSLVSPANSTNVVLPTTLNHIATYTNTVGTLSEDPATAISAGNIQAGLSGTAGALISFPTTAATGSLKVVAASSAGDFITTITNASQAAARTYTIPDAGASSSFLLTNSSGTQTIATGNLALTVGTLTLGSSGHASSLTIFPGTAANGSFIISPVNNAGNHTTTLSSVTALAQNTVYTLPDPGAATANVMLNTGTTTMAAGSKITLDKTTGTTSGFAVTINKQAGVITTEALTTAGGASQAIALTNSQIASTSVIHCQVQGGSNTTQNISFVAAPASGSATITIFNNTAATALNGTIVFSFVVF